MKKIFMALMATALLAGSCSDWTETEAKDYRKPTPEEQNTPEYRSYLEALRNYKQGDHKITMVTVSGTSETPNLQNQHLKAMPDSVDFICMKDAVDLHPTLVSEIQQIYAKKGTRTLCVVDYISVENEWTAMETAKADAGLPAGTTEEWIAYCKERIEEQLACCDKYGFAGIEISYTGNRSNEIGQVGQDTFMECITAWRADHSDKLMFFRGYFQLLKDNSDSNPILSDCDYLVVLCGTSVSSSQLRMEIRRKVTSWDKTKLLENYRFIIEVAIPPLADPAQVGATAEQAAKWILEDETLFVKSGLAVDNLQDDYFNKVRIYDNVRTAMGILSATEEPEPTPES